MESSSTLKGNINLFFGCGREKGGSWGKENFALPDSSLSPLQKLTGEFLLYMRVQERDTKTHTAKLFTINAQSYECRVVSRSEIKLYWAEYCAFIESVLVLSGEYGEDEKGYRVGVDTITKTLHSRRKRLKFVVGRGWQIKAMEAFTQSGCVSWKIFLSQHIFHLSWKFSI